MSEDKLIFPLSTDVDETIDSIEYTFDDHGRLWKVTSYGSSTAKNGVLFAYQDSGIKKLQLAKVDWKHRYVIDDKEGEKNGQQIRGVDGPQQMTFWWHFMSKDDTSWSAHAPATHLTVILLMQWTTRN